MKKCFVVFSVISMGLMFSTYIYGQTFPDEPESKEASGRMLTAGDTHCGGCVLLSPSGEVPENLYQVSEITPTDEYKPFTKKLTVYGITLVGRDEISDEFMHKVAKTIASIFPREGEHIDAELQAELIRNMYRYKTVIPLFYGKEHEFSEEDEALLNATISQNSMCDIIMEGVDGQITEVMEHILHHVTDVGLHYTFEDEWGITETSDAYMAVREAIDKGYYDVKMYRNDPEQAYNRVLIQEYGYWIIYAVWELRESFSPGKAEFNIMNGAELKEQLPASYNLVVQTIPKVMRAPDREMLREFFE